MNDGDVRAYGARGGGLSRAALPPRAIAGRGRGTRLAWRQGRSEPLSPPQLPVLGMVGELRKVLGQAPLVKSFNCFDDASMKSPSTFMQDVAVCHVVRQRVLEDFRRGPSNRCALLSARGGPDLPNTMREAPSCRLSRPR